MYTYACLQTLLPVAREQVSSGDPVVSKKRKLPSSSGPDEPG